ncbi:unnamed protein product [Rhodiola kirilowii]
MALSPSLANTTTSYSSLSSTAPFRFSFNPNQSDLRIRLLSRAAAISCSADTELVNSPTLKLIAVPTKSKRKPRPSFHEQIKEKWSLKIDSPRQNFPWQEKPKQEEEVTTELVSRVVEVVPAAAPRVENIKQPVISDFSNNRRVLAPWFQEREPVKPQSAVVGVYSEYEVEVRVQFEQESEPREVIATSSAEELENAELTERDIDFGKEKAKVADFNGEEDNTEYYDGKRDTDKSVIGAFDYAVNTAPIDEVKELAGSVAGAPYMGVGDKTRLEQSESPGALTSVRSTVDLPWLSKQDREGMEKEKWVKSNTMLAEKLIPDHELKRLRNVSLRMLERISVGPAGITQDIVDAVHRKWRTDEVVKLKFEGPSSVNMKRNHEGLERRTGGLVIWRSGGSIVLFRGMTYKLPCAQAFKYQGVNNAEMSKESNNAQFDVSQNVARNFPAATTISHMPSKSKYIENLSEEELIDMSELNLLLDELGPRFYDWSGPEPLPVDADSLPSFVPGYRPPIRLLPNGAKRCLGNKKMTSIRRLARSMPPHFALGRNRDLQGLAQAMVKLWQTNAIAKIAIKRGVLNTLNEKMAEELKRLTGGTLVSRNKEYIVFHRGKDFLPQAVTQTLEERKKLTELHQDEEELVRQKASINFKVKSSKAPLVAGTLAETVAATSRWGSQPSKEEMAKMMKEAAFEKHASLVRYLEKKLVIAKSKVAKAEKALRKVQEYLEPAELPTDLEIITDEERFLFRKMGLSMKPFLLIGRRKVFDGTIQNIHLHWKFRELVKLIVKENNFALVKHIAISLEAESGGVLVSVDKTTQGYAIIIYRGKNYQRPSQMRPKNLLTRRQALARSIELQRREALKHHILDLEEKIDLLKSGLEEIQFKNENGDKIEDNNLYTKMNSGYFSDKDDAEDEGEEAYLQVYDDSGHESSDAKYENSYEICDESIDDLTKISSHCVNDITDSESVSSNLWI